MQKRINFLFLVMMGLWVTGCGMKLGNDPRHFGTSIDGVLSKNDVLALRKTTPYPIYGKTETVDAPEAGTPLTSTGSYDLEASKLRFGH